MDIHQALNWRAIWPLLRTLPADAPLRLLDAGCGEGNWSRRIAGLRPQWHVVGMDRDTARLQRAVVRQKSDALANLSYVEGDFVERIDGTYDVVLSIAAIHHAAADGRGVDVARSLQRALAPGGRLVLLVPRCQEEQPVWRSLPRPQGWPVFGTDELEQTLEQGGLKVTELHGLYGRWCLLGKQLAMWGARSKAHRLVTAPAELLVRGLPLGLIRERRSRSYALVAVATRA